jgi:hypothetical protein
MDCVSRSLMAKTILIVEDETVLRESLAELEPE